MFQDFLLSTTAFTEVPEDSMLFQSSYKPGHAAHQELLHYLKVLFTMIIFNILRNIIRNILTIYNMI